jgi:PEGA domain-containing protein
MNPISSPKSKSLRGITTIAAAAFVLAVGSSPAFAQRGGGGGHAAGGAGHVGGGMGGGHAMGGGHPQGTGGGHPQGAGGGHPQGTPGPGSGGEPNRHSNPDAMKGDGHHHDDGHHVDHGDHGRDFDHDHGDHFDHHDHDRDFHPHVFYYDPFFWGWSYPYYPYYPYIEYQWHQDNSDPSYGSFPPAYNSPSETENGGITLDATPPDALVYADNNYAGMANSFSSSQPLWLAAGSHRIELLATGFAPVSLEVNVVAGRVVPYRVNLTPTSDR